MLSMAALFVLERGAIEAYYPQTVTGRDKLTKAQAFCKVTSRETALSLCGEQDVDGEGSRAKEFDIIFGTIFDN